MKQQWLIIGAIVVVLFGSYLWNRSRANTQAENVPAAEEIITQADGTVVRRSGDKIEEISAEEAEARKKEISEKVANANSTSLKAAENQTGSGTSARTFENGTYYQRIQVEGMAPLQKGYFYEGWLQNPNGEQISIGRIEMGNGSGSLYYSAKEDKSVNNKVVVSREIEDGNANIGEVVLTGEH